MRKTVLLLHTGGTLGMVGRRPHTVKPAPFAEALRARVPELTELANVELELFSNLDSSEVQPEAWLALARRLHQRLPGVDGAVVIHGTDTLAYTASALSFLLPGLRRPVVLTGSQRPLQEVRSDARLNLIDAVTSALRGPPEVTVCFDSHLYRGNRTVKVKVAEYDAFASPNFPPLGTLGVHTHFLPGLRPRGRPGLLPGLEPRVFLLKVFPGLDPALPLLLLPQLRGLVVEAYGAGNVPVEERSGRSLLPLFRAARARGIPVLVVSQAQRNAVELGLYQGGAAIAEEGAIDGGDLTAPAAVTKLMCGLALHTQGPALRRYLETSVAGERS
jgi:L-asparaginase